MEFLLCVGLSIESIVIDKNFCLCGVFILLGEIKGVEGFRFKLLGKI